MQSNSAALPELAFYYPNPVWMYGDWIKNLLLFFDGVALLVPDYMRERPYELDPALVSGLEEAGLLEVLEPETFIDKTAAEGLATAMTDLLASGALDGIPRSGEFHELSRSRLGYMADEGLAEMLFEELEARGLAKQTEDGLSIPMNPLVRSLILVLLAQILRPAGRERGLELSPATDRPEIQRALKELLDLPTMASAGHVVARDLETVGVDVAAVPLDELLAFKTEHGDAFRKYARDLRAFLREVQSAEEAEREQALADRVAELEEAARSLRKVARSTWRRSGALFALGLTGAMWMVAEGDIVGGLLALGASAAAAAPVGAETTAYSYLFSASRLR